MLHLQEIIVPRKRTGVVLGPGGQTASEIRRHCRCQLHVRKDTRPDDTQTVEISGSLMQVGVLARAQLSCVCVCACMCPSAAGAWRCML